jgi:hypothetical protein
VGPLVEVVDDHGDGGAEGQTHFTAGIDGHGVALVTGGGECALCVFVCS